MVWAGGLDAIYRDAVSRSYAYTVRCDVCDRSGTVLYRDLPFVDGSVSATLSSRVARTLAMTVTRDWFPVTTVGTPDPKALLAPFGNRLRVFAGITYGDGNQVLFPVFYGRIESVILAQSGQVAVNAVDLAADVVDAQFEAPENSAPNNAVGTEIKRLITEALPNATYGASDTAGGRVGALTWEQDRAKALDDLAASVGMLWYPLADGSFVIRTSPWAKSGQVAQVTVTDGQVWPANAGQAQTFAATLSRTNVYNSVVVTAERQGETPIYAIARDLDPTSPTYYLGNFGKKPTLIQNQTPLTQQQCSSQALVWLKGARSIQFTISPVQIMPDASLELGDLVQFNVDVVRSTQVINGFTLPLRESSAMLLDLRAYAPVS